MVQETERLIFRKFAPTDLEAVYPIFSSPEVMKYSVTGALDKSGTKERLFEVIKSYQDNGFGKYAVIEKASNLLIGYCGLEKPMEKDFLQPELGYRFVHKSWGKGYATESASAIVETAFQEYKLAEIIGFGEPENVNSIKVLLKVGMCYWKDAKYFNKSVKVFIMTAEDFRKLKK
ncbi:MAG: GNAT family N-acetyltransferase [Candidatus Riflebacteria bacterium]|nr:GNAT family N-acetyltransferase [Candidatus Riflebacteria bacterium]